MKKITNITELKDGMKVIPLTKGKYAIVDDEDYERLNEWKWHFNNGYAKRGIWDGKRKKVNHVIMHRLIINAPLNCFVDHKNHDRLDNRKCNLRVCTPQENQFNQKPRNKTSKYKGLFYHKLNKKWIVQIQKDNKKIHVGSFAIEAEAAIAYNIAARNLFGEFAYLNNIDSLTPIN